LPHDILAGFGGAVAAPSANHFGHVSPTSAGHVLADLRGRIELIVDGGVARPPCFVPAPCRVRRSSRSLR
jgi:tRNA A37 threonylcarbamoyladenosine synthetase subunit TsaC/SUA5/YrdC